MKMQSEKLVTMPLAFPVYDDARLYQVAGGFARAWEFSGWKAESMSWKTGCYIHAGLSSPFGQSIFRGPDVIKFFSSICVNSFETFPIGSAKHVIMCNDAGLITGHGVLQRNAEHEVQFFVGGLWASYQCSKTTLNVEEIPLNNYLFQIAGPTSLDTLEKACGEDLRDIGFLRFRKTRVAGVEAEIMRVGMSGTLAYELHGPMEDAQRVYDAVYRAGLEFGIQRLGWRTYTVNHVEAGFPQSIWTFDTACLDDEGYSEFIGRFPNSSMFYPAMAGSVSYSDTRARQRNPYEVGWGFSVKFDHDFIGREALEKVSANRTRKIVTLVWNPEDVLDIYGSLLRDGQEYKTLDLPTSPHLKDFLAHADHVLKAGREIGWSSGTIYSYYFRKVISHGVIEITEAEIGNEVILQWGDCGGPIKDVRATVERYPYLDLKKNKDIDVVKS